MVPLGASTVAVSKSSSTKTIWIADLLRWVAAGLVALSHARDNLLVDYPNISNPNLPVKLLYFVSGFGHEAVIVFFVLSGYLVGGPLWTRHKDRAPSDGSLLDYYIHRFSRIYVVLLPALLLIWLLDSVGGSRFAAAHIYDRADWSYSLDFVAASRLGGTNFLCNLANLQGAFCPTFGTDGPLWSLSYEWFYYLTFPAFILMNVSIGKIGALSSAATRILTQGSAAVAALALGATFLTPFRLFIEYYPIWLFGVAAHSIAGTCKTPRFVTWVAATVMFAALIAGRLGWRMEMGSDYAIALGLAVVLGDRRVVRFRGSASRVHASLAGFSYSLYTIHFPIVVFAVAGLRDKGYLATKAQPDAIGWALLGVMIGGIYLVAWGFSRLTEKHTSKLRRYIGAALQPIGKVESREPPA